MVNDNIFAINKSITSEDQSEEFDDSTNEAYSNFEKEDDSEQLVTIGRKIEFNRSERRIRDLKSDETDGLLEKQPFFQRKYVWNDKKASLFIESLLLNVPIPLIYTAEDKLSGTELVIDGQQRITSAFRFINNEFSLKGLRVFNEELEGKKFKEIKQEYQLKITRYPLSIIKISADSDEEVKFEIFERINSGAANLKEQELRNCIYRGHYNEFIKDCAADNMFIDILFSGKEPKRMENSEMVLRFFAFYLNGYTNYPGRLKTFLNEHMKINKKIFDKGEDEKNHKLKNHKKIFKKSLELSKYVFGDKAFRTCNLKSDKKLAWGNINKSLFDIVMTGFAQYEKHQIIPNSDSIREALINLIINDPKFITSSGTLQKSNVIYRFTKWYNELQSIINHPKQARSFSYELKNELYTKNPVCEKCGQAIRNIDDAELDHHKPYWRGGETIEENARLMHRFCNRSKSGN
ncbi:MAG: DUF262 domain-containing protein [Eubacteriales bacterium]